MRGSAADISAKAWVQLENAYRKAGAAMSVIFEDGAIGIAIQDVFGGWVGCCNAMHPVYRPADDVSWEDRQAARLERREVETRLIQVGGLSPEMLRAKQKEFEAAYRRVPREKKLAPSYHRGECEIENLRTVAGWTKGTPVKLSDGRDGLKLPIYIQGEVGRKVEAEFDFHTAALVNSISELCERAPLALPPAPEQKLLTESTEPPIAPEAAREILKDAISNLTGLMRMPEPKVPLTPEQWEARRQELKRQAEGL